MHKRVIQIINYYDIINYFDIADTELVCARVHKSGALNIN